VADNFCANTLTNGIAVGGGGFGDQNGLGTLVVLGSTFVGNSTNGNGGGIFETGPSTTINDSTITGNTALQEGGGLYVTSAAFTLQNTIVAGNFSNAGGMNFQGATPDLLGTPTTALANFIGGDPRLGPLQNNGGPVVGGLNLTQTLPTEAPLAGSPVIDAGGNAVIPAGTTTDQRGFNRIVNNTLDIGAVEYQPPTTTTTLLAPPSVTAGNPLLLEAIVSATTPGSNPVTGFVTFTVDGVPVGGAAVTNGVATFTLPTLTPGNHLLGAIYSGSTLFSTSSGATGTSASIPNIPSSFVPPGTVLSAPPNNFVFISVMTVKMHGKKFQEFVIFNTSGVFIEGRFVLSGLSLQQYGKLMGLSKQQLANVPTFDGFPVVDLFLAPGGQQMVQVPAGAAFTPIVIAGL
jgi:hypothetical protein